jgi:hypothetical protein
MIPCILVSFIKVSEKITASIPEDRYISSSERLNLPVSTEPIQDHSINIRGNVNLVLKKNIYIKIP